MLNDYPGTTQIKKNGVGFSPFIFIALGIISLTVFTPSIYFGMTRTISLYKEFNVNFSQNIINSNNIFLPAVNIVISVLEIIYGIWIKIKNQRLTTLQIVFFAIFLMLNIITFLIYIGYQSLSKLPPL